MKNYKLNSGSWKGWRLGRCSRKHNATGGKNIQNIISAFANLDIATYLIHLIHLIFWSPPQSRCWWSDQTATWRSSGLRDSAWGLSLLPQARYISQSWIKIFSICVHVENSKASFALLSSNVLHSSGPNTSLDRRWNLVLAYNQVQHTFFFAKLGLDPGEECSDNFWVSSSPSTSPCCWGWRCPRQGQVSFTFMVIDITNHNRAESTISKMYIVHADDTSTQKLEWCNGWVLGNACYERKYQKI